MSEPRPNKVPHIWQIVDTYGIRVLQNNGAKPARLLVSISLAKKLAAELARDCYDITNGVIPRVRFGICTDFMGMGTRIVRDDEIADGEFDIDYVPCEHKPYTSSRRRNRSPFTDESVNSVYKMYEEWIRRSHSYTSGSWGL